MRLAIISDIHANLDALESCLAECQGQNIDRHVFLGDLVGYGPDPEAVVRRVMQFADAGAIVLKGNHDAAAIGERTSMNDTAGEAIRWTRTQISDGAKRFLASLPLQATEGENLFVHSDASDPAAWHYVTDATTAQKSLEAVRVHATFCGHVHVPALYCISATGKIIHHKPVTAIETPLSSQRRWLAVIGSAGQPRDHIPSASFAIYDTTTRILRYHRAPYQIENVADRIIAAGLPRSLAARLFIGR